MTKDAPKQTLNIRSPALKGLSDTNTDKLRKAVERKMLHKETFEEAWERIMSMKNSEADTRRLYEVKRAMESGEIERESESTTKRFSKAEALRMWKVLDEQKAQERLRKMVEETPDNYWLITDPILLTRFLRLLDEEDEIVFDVETTGTDVYTDYIVGHVLTAVKADIHVYIPTRHDDPRFQLANDYVNRRLQPYYENETLGKIAHNASFDIAMLDNEGITLKGLSWDTQEAMRLMNENEERFALKPLVSKYLHLPSQTYGELFGNKSFAEVPLDQALAYAAKDGDVTLKLRNFQRYHMSKMPKMLEYYETVEVPIIPLTVDMMKEGYIIDIEHARKYGDELRKESEELGKEVFGVLGDINLNSPVQLKAAIEEHIGREIENTNAKQTLKPLSKEFPVIKRLLRYREVNKLLSTYIDVLPTLIKERTGRVHAGMYPNGTVTGRYSSGSDKSDGVVSKDGLINIQNQPKEAREMFISPEGYYIVNADFSSQEVRIIASESKEDVLLEAFKNNRDPYATLASQYYGLPYEDCYKNADGSDTQVRKEMKVVLLQSLYGASKYGIAESLGITPDEAEKFRKNFFNTYKKIDAFIKRTQAFANKHGYVWIGDKQRKRRLPDAKGDVRRYDPKRNRAMRQGPNAKIQGRASIQTKVTLLRMKEEAINRGWIIWATVHDEIILLMPTNSTKEDFVKLNEIMTQSYLLDGVENKTDIEVQRRWGDSITVEEFINGKEVPKL